MHLLDDFFSSLSRLKNTLNHNYAFWILVSSLRFQTSSTTKIPPPHIPFFGIFVTNSTNTILLPYHPHTTYWVCLIVNCRRAKAIYSLSIPIYIIRVCVQLSFAIIPFVFISPFFRFFPSTRIIMMCRQQNRWRTITSFETDL